MVRVVTQGAFTAAESGVDPLALEFTPARVALDGPQFGRAEPCVGRSVVASLGAIPLGRTAGLVSLAAILANAGFGLEEDSPGRVDARGRAELPGMFRPTREFAAALAADENPLGTLVRQPLASNTGRGKGLFAMRQQLLGIVAGAVLAVAEEFQVLKAVVRLVPVPMVDVVVLRDRPVGLFPDEPMQPERRLVVAAGGEMPHLSGVLDALITHAEDPGTTRPRGTNPCPSIQTG